jgi:predicted transcriptional regulator
MGFIDSFKRFADAGQKLDDQKILRNIIKANCFIREDSSIEDCIRVLRNRSVTGMPVINNNHQVVGFISEKDCLKFLYGAFYFNEISGDVSKYMNKNVTFITSNMNLQTILQMFTDNPFHVYPVVDDNKKYMGILTRTDLLTEIYAIMDLVYNKAA